VQDVPISVEAAELDEKLPDGYKGILAPALPGALIQPFTLPREAPPPGAKVRRALHEAVCSLRWWAHGSPDSEDAPRRSLLSLLENLLGPSLQPEGAPGSVPAHGKGVMMGAGIDLQVLTRDSEAVCAMLTDRKAMASVWTPERREQCASAAFISPRSACAVGVTLPAYVHIMAQSTDAMRAIHATNPWQVKPQLVCCGICPCCVSKLKTRASVPHSVPTVVLSTEQLVRSYCQYACTGSLPSRPLPWSRYLITRCRLRTSEQQAHLASALERSNIAISALLCWSPQVLCRQQPYGGHTLLAVLGGVQLCVWVWCLTDGTKTQHQGKIPKREHALPVQQNHPLDATRAKAGKYLPQVIGCARKS
jgi:hypothetical protein